MHHQFIAAEIKSLIGKKNINPKILKRFLDRLENPQFIREENITDHFCVFFLPVDKKLKSLYLGHHIKANDWIPPGGHIEKNEHPKDTVKREMFEELQYQITGEAINLYDLTVKDIENPLHPCKRHYDLWYLVYMDKANFIFDKGEFYNAKWFNQKTAKQITKLKDYREVIQKFLLRSNNLFPKPLLKLSKRGRL